jgi:hypothetical protein
MNAKSKAVTRAQPFEAAELFSPRQRPRLPGQDPGRCEALFQELCSYFKPQDAIECMWVNDVASIMSRIEYLRNSHRAAALVSLRRELADNARYKNDISSYEMSEAKSQIYAEENGDAQASASSKESLPFTRLLGAASMGSLRKEEDFMGLEFAAMRERDRIIAQITRKRREDMIAAVQVIDMKNLDSGAQD